MILYDRSEAELNRIALDYLGNTDITNTKPGSRARILLRTFNRLLRSYYATLDFNVTMAFVSHATGPFLDEIGLLLNCTRLEGETDDNYRYRITHQVESAAAANETAIRLAALSVDGVVDVFLRPYSHGTGSFSVYFTTETPPDPEEEDEILGRVQAAIDSVKAYGVKGVATRPKNLFVSLEVQVGFDPSVRDRMGISRDIERAVRRRINELSMGEELIITDLIYDIRAAGGDSVKDCSIATMRINNKPVVVHNYKPHWDEKFYTDEVLII